MQIPNQAQPELALVHIVGGLHIVGRVTRQEEGLLIEKPMQLLTFRAPNGQIAGGTLEAYGHLGLFRPFDKVQFNYIHVLHIVPDLPSQIEKQYLQATTGIQLATA